MIEKLMLEFFFSCVRIADLLSSVFLVPWKPWTLHLYLNFHCYQFKTWNLVIKSVIYLCDQKKILKKILKCFIFVSMATFHHNLRLNVQLVVSFKMNRFIMKIQFF